MDHSRGSDGQPCDNPRCDGHHGKSDAGRIAEAEVYSKFDEIAGDKTAIYISHRLSSCKFCDEIAVFHEGAVVQQGTHAELVADERGKYYELWHAQAQYYAE